MEDRKIDVELMMLMRNLRVSLCPVTCVWQTYESRLDRQRC